MGGVGCNKRLHKMLTDMAEAPHPHTTQAPPVRPPCAAPPALIQTRASGARTGGGLAYTTDERYCIDNGAMIAYTGARAPVPTRRNFR